MFKALFFWFTGIKKAKHLRNIQEKETNKKICWYIEIERNI